MTIVHNPVIWADVPDIDTIRIKDAYYMVSTSMHSMPGCPIMKSKDLAHWELVGYVYDSFEDNAAHNLEDEKGIYSNGSWAASLRYHNGCCYVVFNCNDTRHFYVYKSEDIETCKWERIARLDAFMHDPALFFEDDGTPYIIYGNGDIHIVELTKDLTAIKEGGINQLLFSTPRENIMLPCEGGHAYKINGIYYIIFIEWPRDGHQRRRVICYRAKELLGPYERKLLFDDDMGYKNCGIAQGCIFDTPAGDWYAMLFQDHHAVGRIPYVLPMTWEDGWPVIGTDGKAPKQFEVNLPETERFSLVISDEFDYRENKLALQWQWNHNPNPAGWSVTERPGFLRLRTVKTVKEGLWGAQNTLTQRTEGPSCEAVAKMDISGMKDGDTAGLAALQGKFAFVGIRKDEDDRVQVIMCERGDGHGERCIDAVDYEGHVIYFKAHFDFEESVDMVYFFYSKDGMNWKQIGKGHKLVYTLEHFMGCRIGLFSYATKEAGGYADFDYIHYTKFV